MNLPSGSAAKTPPCPPGPANGEPTINCSAPVWPLTENPSTPFVPLTYKYLPEESPISPAGYIFPALNEKGEPGTAVSTALAGLIENAYTSFDPTETYRNLLL